MLVHLLLGVGLAGGLSLLAKTSFWWLLPYAVVGSFLPDMDHLAFYFVYGRKSEYAKRVKGHLKKREIRAMCRFVAYNHKQLYGLYSHTWYGVLLVIVGSWWGFEHSVELGTLFAAMLGHFGFDIFEDAIFFRKLNPNWRGKVLRYSVGE
jgi:hypothetical protein